MEPQLEITHLLYSAFSFIRDLSFYRMLLVYSPSPCSFLSEQQWNLTDVKLSVILEPGNPLTVAVSALPGSSSSYARSWSVLLMEHSSDYQFLYVSLPLCSEKKLLSGTGSMRRASTTNFLGNKG